MCGIAGFIDIRVGKISDSLYDSVSSMAESISHRGPDDRGVWVDAGSGVALSHRRLSIVDLSPEGHQPMLSAGDRYVIIFNGEIYNFKKIKKEQKGKLKLEKDTDVGFKILKLQKSHFAEWEYYVGKSTSQLELRLGQSETPLVEGWIPNNLLSEILLLQGFPLDSKVRSLSEFKANEVQQVISEFVGHHLFICLDKKVKAETVAKINLRPEDILVCLDSALSDEAKVKLADQCNLKVI